MNALAHKVYDINFDFILNNYLNPKLWRAAWTIFKYDDIEVVLRLDRIHVQNKHLSMELKVVQGPRDDIFSSSVTTSFDVYPEHEDETTEAAERRLHSRVIRLFRSVEDTDIADTEMYKRARQQNREHKDYLRELAEEFLDSEGVTHEDIREAYIDSFVWDNVKDFRNDVRDALKFKMRTALMLTYCSLFDLDERYEEIRHKADLSESRDKIIRQEIADFQKQLDEGELTYEMEEVLG